MEPTQIIVNLLMFVFACCAGIAVTDRRIGDMVFFVLMFVMLYRFG